MICDDPDKKVKTFNSSPRSSVPVVIQPPQLRGTSSLPPPPLRQLSPPSPLAAKAKVKGAPPAGLPGRAQGRLCDQGAAGPAQLLSYSQ